jgi:hypothetical protein
MCPIADPEKAPEISSHYPKPADTLELRQSFADRRPYGSLAGPVISWELDCPLKQ